MKKNYTIIIALLLSSALNAKNKVLSFLPPPNTPPTIVAAAGQSTELWYFMGSAIANIEFVVDDSETLFKDLVVTAVSSNPVYIADSEITAFPDPTTFVTNGQRYLGITANTIIPPVFVNGFTDITVTVTDGDGLTATKVFRIHIEDASNPTIDETANTPPTIVLATGQNDTLRYYPGSPIANIEFIVGDRETLFKDLVVTFSSSNQDYIFNSEIAAYPDPATFVTNGQRYLGITGNTIIPPVFVNGFTDITITVTDGDGLTATQVVRIFIEDVSNPTIDETANTPPTIVLATGQNDTLRYCPGSPIANIEIVIGDRETLFKDLVVTFSSSNQAYIADSEITAYPDPATFVTNGQRYLGITGNTIIPPVFVNGFTDITITVTDGDGLTVNQVVRIFIEDLSIPTIDKTGAIASGAIDKTLSSSSCDYTLEDFTGNVTVSDDCTDTPNIVITQQATLNGTTYNIGDTIPGQDGDEVLVTLTAEDLVGKTATTTFTITLQDETAPVLTVTNSVVNEDLAVDATDCKFTIKDYTQGIFANVSLVEACTPGATIIQSPAAGTVVDYLETNQEQTITFTCTDAAGNAATPVTFTVKVKDNTNPVAKSLAAKTVNLSSTIIGGIYTFTGAELNDGSTDNCQIVSYTYLPAFVDCDTVGTTVSVTMTVTDLSGNTATSSTDVTVFDVYAPVITVADIVIGTPTCLTSLLSDPTIDVVLTDNCTVLPSTLMGKRSDDLDLFDPYPFGETTITWTVQDSAGNGATVTQKVTMNDNEFPAFVDATLGVLPSPSPLDQSFFNLSYDSLKDVGSTDVYPADMLTPPTVIDFTDYTGCDEEVTDIPVTMLTPEFLHLGTNTVTWTATDKYGNIVSATQVVTIEDNTIPVITLKNVIPPFLLDANGQVVITPADLNDGTTDGFNGNALKLTVVPNTFGCESAGKDVSVTFFVEDYVGGLVVPDANGIMGDVSHKVYKQTTVRIEDKFAPTVLTKNITVQLNASGVASIVATDVDNGSSDACGIKSMSVSPNTFTCSDVATPVTVTLTVTDVNGNIASSTAVVTVEDKIVPVVITKNLTVQLNVLGTVTILPADVNNGSTDNCGISSYSLSKDTFTCANVGSNVISLTATDASGNSKSAFATVTVQDVTAPVVITKNITVQLNAAGVASIVASDVDNGSTDACGIDSYSLDRTTFSCTDIGNPVTITLKVTDKNNNFSTKTAIVTVEDKVKPIARPISTITLQLDNSGSVTVLAKDLNNGSTDNCSITSYTIGGDSSKTFTCANISTPVSLSFNAIDSSGNISDNVANVTIIIEDKIVPNVLTKNITVQLNSSGTVTIVPTDINNGSTDNCSISSYSLSKDTFTCANVGSNTVALTAKDASGNTSIAFATVIVEDKIAPVIVTKDINLVLNNGSITIVPADVLVSATDACGANIASYTLSKSTFTNVDALASPVTITVYATDINGNVGSATAKVTFTTNLSLDTYKKEKEITIYPNPTTSVLHLQYSNEVIIDKVVVRDLNGKIVVQQAEETSEINVEKLASGIYTIEANSGKEKFKTKFIKK